MSHIKTRKLEVFKR